MQTSTSRLRSRIGCLRTKRGWPSSRQRVTGAYRAAEAALERPRVHATWIIATTAAQRQLVRLLDDKAKFVQTDGGKVVLDLRPIVVELGDQIVGTGKVADRLPLTAAKITIVNESQLETAQTLVKVLRAVANWMWLIALSGRGARDLARARTSQARAPRARDRRAVRRARRDADRAPRCGGLPREQPRQRRQRQARSQQHVEHPDAGIAQSERGSGSPSVS